MQRILTDYSAGKLLRFGLLGLLLLLVACGPSSQRSVQETPSGQAPNVESVVATPVVEEPGSGYPPAADAPQPTAIPESYPPDEPPASPTPEVYPPPKAEEVFQEPRFRIDSPLKAGATQISGQAPPNMALAVINVTYNGEIVGSGVSTAENTFNIGVTELQEGHIIGITFAALEPGLDIGEMSIKYFPHRGDGFLNPPNVGIMLDSVQVEP